jgi:hypothetical protein
MLPTHPASALPADCSCFAFSRSECFHRSFHRSTYHAGYSKTALHKPAKLNKGLAHLSIDAILEQCRLRCARLVQREGRPQRKQTVYQVHASCVWWQPCRPIPPPPAILVLAACFTGCIGAGGRGVEVKDRESRGAGFAGRDDGGNDSIQELVEGCCSLIARQPCNRQRPCTNVATCWVANWELYQQTRTF